MELGIAVPRVHYYKFSVILLAEQLSFFQVGEVRKSENWTWGSENRGKIPKSETKTSNVGNFCFLACI